MSKQTLFNNLERNLHDSFDPHIEVKRGRDMGGEWLTLAFVNDDGEREAYTIEAERIN